MRYTGRKGWKCSTQDAWNLDGTLSPIILAGLKAFKEMDRHGLPSKALKEMEKSGVIGKPDENFVYSDEDMEKASVEWEIILDKMIYAFNTDNEPDISDYDFTIKMVEKEKLPNGSISMDFNVIGEAESKRYDEDTKDNKERSEEGFELFGLYFSSLWD